jgi:sulfite exporter TauE/SafE
MAAGLVVSALELGRRLPALPGLARIPLLFLRLGGAVPPLPRAALRGAATPFLPCGLLYGAFVIAIGAGSAAAGLAVMAAFALGAIPALALVQANARWLAAPTRGAAVARRLLPLVAAAILVWRALGAASGAPPACHHAAHVGRDPSPAGLQPATSPHFVGRVEGRKCYTLVENRPAGAGVGLAAR